MLPKAGSGSLPGRHRRRGGALHAEYTHTGDLASAQREISALCEMRDMLAGAVAAKDERIAELGQELRGKDARLDELEVEAVAKEELLAYLRKDAGEKEGLLDDLQAALARSSEDTNTELLKIARKELLTCERERDELRAQVEGLKRELSGVQNQLEVARGAGGRQRVAQLEEELAQQGSALRSIEAI